MNKIDKDKLGLLLLSAGALAVSCDKAAEPKAKQPNVIVILADDLGVGDVSAYGSTTISTPNIDKLAHQGVQFNRGYATSATSTPSRYALLTGEYPWKNKDAKILPGDAPLLIDTAQYTLPKMMRSAGYTTGAIGKWHLGMGDGNVNWNEHITPCANDIGFDYSCLIAATNDRVPTVFVQDGNVVGLEKDDPLYVNYEKNYEGEPTAFTNPEMLKMDWDHGHNNSIMNGIGRIGYQTGGKAAMWVDEDMADYFSQQVKSFIDANKEQPFFLYYGLHEPHVPRAPHSRFVGSTNLGPRGDAVTEADWCVGELISYLEKEGLLDNTIIIFSSDNGPVLNDGYKDGAIETAEIHDQLGGLRGGKYSLFEGGTRVPLMVYWKGHIEPLVSEAMVSQIDIMPSLGALVGVETPNMDAMNLLDAFMGKNQNGRESIVHEAGGKLAYRKGDWVMIPGYKGAELNAKSIETGNSESATLWNLKNDPAQTTDLAAENPEKVNELMTEFLELTKGYYNPDTPDMVFESNERPEGE